MNCSKVQFDQIQNQILSSEFLPNSTPNEISNPTPVVCSEGSKKECSNSMGYGFQTCHQGVFEECEIVNCFNDYQWNNTLKVCDPKPCSQGDQISCSVLNSENVIIGSGLKTCLSGNYGACVPSSCNSGYHLSESNPPVCLANACNNSDKKSCETLLGRGELSCSNFQWSAECQITSCNDPSSYELINGKCVPKIVSICSTGSNKACVDSTNHGSGIQTCNSDGMGFGGCLLNSCEEGYVLSNGICVTQCTPNLSEACLVSNGLGNARAPRMEKDGDLVLWFLAMRDFLKTYRERLVLMMDNQLVL